MAVYAIRDLLSIAMLRFSAGGDVSDLCVQLLIEYRRSRVCIVINGVIIGISMEVR